jgi:Cu/Ag efflux protein CusF
MGFDKEQFQKSILWHLRWHSFLLTVNFCFLLIVMVIFLTVGVKVTHSDTMADVQASMRHARVITNNMIPVSQVTARTMLRNSTENQTMAEAATQLLSGLAEGIDAALGNATMVMHSVANINFTSITGLFSQAQDAHNQKVVQGYYEHAVSSIDFTTTGVYNLYSIFLKGLSNNTE